MSELEKAYRRIEELKDQLLKAVFQPRKIMSEEQTEYTLSNKEYHELPSTSHGSLECFRNSKRTYKAAFIDKTLTRKQTPAMQLGSLVHAIVLEPQRMDKLYVVSEKHDRRTTAGKAAHAAFAESAGDREIVDADTMVKAADIAHAVTSNKAALVLLDCDGIVEQPMFWECPITGMKCRSKPDFRIPRLIVDLKTTQDATPQGFANAAARFGYARQAAWYRWGYELCAGGPCRFIFIAVSTNEPYEVGLYELSDWDIERSRLQNAKDLAELSRCYLEDDWEGEHERGIVKLQLPKWVEYEDQYQVY